jgi:D-inositol-3-phosphate glycosyltransferase
MGIHVDVFTRSQDEHVPHVLHDLGYGNRVVHVPAGPEVPLPKKELTAYLPEFVAGIKNFVQNKGAHYDLIHSHYWMSGVAALELKTEWNIPVVHMFHTLGLMKNRVAQSPEELEGEYRIEGERKVLKSVDRIVAATPAELAQLQWLYQSDVRNIVVIPPGVDLSHFYPIPVDEAKEVIDVPASSYMLLFVGRIEPLKGLDVLIEALSLIHQEGILDTCRLCLSVIGGDPEATNEQMDSEMKRLQTLREKFGLQDMITFLGQRSQDTLPYYYSAAEAVVVPSHYESFGMVALEAMACGTPVVASQVGGLAFLVQDGETGFHVPDGDAQALSERLTVLLKDNKLRHKMGNNATAFASQYSWDKISNRLIKVYKDVLKSD